MTTIVANYREMCADSCTSWDSEFIIAQDKIEIIDRQVVGCAGSTPDITKFTHWLRDPASGVPEFSDDDDKGFIALVLNERGLFLYANSVRPMRVTEPFAAIGSGGSAAKAAMLAGKPPRVAVHIATLCDKNSKLPVQRVRLAQALRARKAGV